MSKQTDGRNMLSNAILAIILILVGFGVVGAHLKIAELKELNAEFEKKVNALNHEVKTVQSQILILNNIVVDLHRKITKLETEVAALKKEITKQGKKRKAEIEKTAATIADVKKDIAELRELIKQNVNDLKALEKNTQAAFNDNYENLSLVVAKMNEIIDFANDASKKIEKLEKDLGDLKNKRTCPLPPWRKK
ncbi:MAG: hypothetical protein AAB851_01700 [Patescibacteria group bacterium]